MLEDSVSRGEKYDLYIDLHRDAYSSGMTNQNTVLVGDQKIARLMMLIGKGTGQTYEVRPDWEKNQAIAQIVTNALNEQVPDLCHPIRLKTGRFNQHIAPCCILVEVGNNKNTLEEALTSVPYLAEAIRSALNQSPTGQ
jgi:stage II sporulation protein P